MRGDEAFGLSVSFAEGDPETQQAVAQISDDETAPQLLIDVEPATEGQGGLALFVRLDRPTTIPLTFVYETSDGTALAGRDYVATMGTLELGPGQTAI